ncbi:MAG: hypothetical protein GX442_02210 [Candidatus Riflebacteria bacterium]|nr:hypothetical protein [Candidatus Riflebacteria bacterium]
MSRRSLEAPGGLSAIRSGGRLAVPPGDLREALSFCTGCQSCRATCPNGVDTCLVTLLGRLLLPKSPLQAWKEWGCSLLARWPWGRRFLGRMLFGPAGPGGRGGGDGSLGAGRREPEAGQGLAGGRSGAPEANPGKPGGASEVGMEGASEASPVGGSRAKGPGLAGPVVLVPGFRLARFPHLVEAAANLMAACGGGERPTVETAWCGELALEIPDLEGYSRQLGAWLETIGRHAPGRIVVACPHCLEALGRARDLCEASSGEARLLDRVTDLYSWLREAGFRPVSQGDAPAILLDVCANRKDKAMSRAARELLGRCRPSGVEEPAVTGGGCTCRGGFGGRFPSVARTLRRRVDGGGRERGSEELVTVCASCLRAWKGTRGGRVVHLIEVLGGGAGGRSGPRPLNGGAV